MRTMTDKPCVKTMTNRPGVETMTDKPGVRKMTDIQCTCSQNNDWYMGVTTVTDILAVRTMTEIPGVRIQNHVNKFEVCGDWETTAMINDCERKSLSASKSVNRCTLNNATRIKATL